jgi:hypothetical protein
MLLNNQASKEMYIHSLDLYFKRATAFWRPYYWLVNSKCSFEAEEVPAAAARLSLLVSGRMRL